MPLYPNSSLSNDTIISDLIQVKGADGAKNYPTKLNTRDALWDADENYVYVRKTNAQGQLVSLERYKYEPDPIPTPEDVFVTKNDFNSLKGELSDVKQSIQELISAVGNLSTAAESNGSVKQPGPGNGNSKPSKDRCQRNDTINQQQS